MGWFDSSTGKGFRTRMRATGALIARMEGYGINRYMITDYPYKPPEVIILRASKEGGKKKGKEIDYKDTENTICMRDKVNAINTYLRSQCLNLLLKDKDLRDLEERMYAHTEDQGGGEFNYLDFTDTSLRRIFNNGDFQQGGRFYGGWWQSIPSEYRNLITINGKKTVEIDYSGMHFAIMYAQIDLEVPMEDPYELPGIDPKHRKQIKKAFNALINCRTTKEATVLVNTKIETGEWSKELGNGEFLFNAFTEIHEPISGMIASGHGLKAQFYDSEVAERVMLRGIEDGICILPVHDSFIVRAGEENALKDYMKESFRDVLGQTPDLGLVELKGLHHHRSSDPIKAWGADKQGQEKELTGDDDLEGLISFGELVGVGEGMSVDDVIGYQQYELREEECRKAKEL